MWRWRSTVSSIAALSLVLGLAAQAAVKNPASRKKPDPRNPQSSVGPASPAEAEILWKEGIADYETGRYPEAIVKLQRYVDRYPTSPGFAEAQLMIGRSHLQLGHWKEAQPALLAYIGSHSQTLEGHEARLDLARAQIGLKQFNEAYLTSLEVLSAKAPEAIPPKLEIAALLLRTRALVGLGRDERAIQALESARKTLDGIQHAVAAPAVPPAPPPNPFADPEVADLRMEAETLRLQLKIRACAKYPSARSLSEAQALDQLSRRGECLLEASLIVREAVLVPGDYDSLGEILAEGFEGYAKVSRDPPPHPIKRTPKQRSQYRLELSDRLIRSFAQKRAQAVELFRLDAASGEKDRLPSGRDAQVSNLIRRLEQIR